MRSALKALTFRDGVFASPGEVVFVVIWFVLLLVTGYFVVLGTLRYNEEVEKQMVDLVQADLGNALRFAESEVMIQSSAYAKQLAKLAKEGLSPAAMSVMYDVQPPFSGFNHYVFSPDKGVIFARSRMPEEAVETSRRISKEGLPWDLAIAGDSILVVSLYPIPESRDYAGFYLEVIPRTRASAITVTLHRLSGSESLPSAAKGVVVPIRDIRERAVAYASISEKGLISSLRTRTWVTYLYLLLLWGYGIYFLTRNVVLYKGVFPLRQYVENLREALEKGSSLKKMQPTGEPGLDALSEQIDALVTRMRETQLREITQLKELRFIQRLSESLLQVTSRQDLARILVEELHRAIGKGAVILRFLREDRNTLECAAQSGIPEDLIEEAMEQPVGKGLAGRVLLTETPMYVEDYNNSPLRVSSKPGPFYYGYCCPIRSGLKVIGTLSVFTTEQFPITQSIRRTLEIAAQEFGVAYQGLTSVLRLRELKEFNDQILENLSEGVFVESSDGTVEYANPFLLRLLGVRRRSDVVGQRWDTWLKPADRTKIQAIRENPLDLLNTFEVEIQPRNGGLPRRVRVTSTYLIGEETRPRRLIVVTDITEIKEREDLIERNRQFLLRLTNAIPAAVVVFNRSGEIVFCNSAFRSAFCIGEGASFKDVVPEELSGKLEDLLPTDSPTYGLEFEVTAADHARSSKRYWRMDVLPLEDRNEVLCVLVDVTGERELAKKVLETERLIVLGEMSSKLSHQINNPLTGIMGNAELLLSDLPKGSPHYEMVASILQSVERIRKIMSLLEMYARHPEGGRSRFSLNDLIRDIETLYRGLLAVSGIQLEVQLDADLPMVLGDPYQIRQAFIHLITNSQQAYEENKRKGPLLIKTQWVADTREVLVIVQDWAGGMSEVVKERALIPFFSTRSPDRSTGMGLPIVQGIIRAHGGTLDLQSEMGEGTTVTLRLPVDRGQEASVAAEPDISGDTRSIKNFRILVIEDETDVLMPMKRYLETEGAIVDGASTGRQALQYIGIEKYDAILLDLGLPDCRGTEIIQHLAATYPGMLGTLLVTTGLAVDPQEQALLDAYRIPTLRKPFSMSDLKRSILRRIYGKSTESESPPT